MGISFGAIAASIGHIQTIGFNTNVALLTIVGCIVGSQIGPRLLHGVEARILKLYVSLFLSTMGLYMLLREFLKLLTGI